MKLNFDEVIKKIKSETIEKCKICRAQGTVFVFEKSIHQPCVCFVEFSRLMRFVEANIPPEYHKLSLNDFTNKTDRGFQKFTGWLSHIEEGVKVGLGLYIVGKEGSGTTMLACIALKTALEHGYSGYFDNYTGILTRIKEGFHDEDDANFTAILRTVDVLVIDHIRGPKSDYNIEKLTEILDARDFNNKTTIVTDRSPRSTIGEYFESADIESFFNSKTTEVMVQSSVNIKNKLGDNKFLEIMKK